MTILKNHAALEENINDFLDEYEITNRGYVKYELTNDWKQYRYKVVYRIKALINFGDVKRGDLGGYIESEKGLRQRYQFEDKSWVYDNCIVFDPAALISNSTIRGSIMTNITLSNVQLEGNYDIGGFGQITRNDIPDSIINRDRSKGYNSNTSDLNWTLELYSTGKISDDSKMYDMKQMAKDILYLKSIILKGQSIVNTDLENDFFDIAKKYNTAKLFKKYLLKYKFYNKFFRYERRELKRSYPSCSYGKTKQEWRYPSIQYRKLQLILKILAEEFLLAPSIKTRKT